MDDYEYWFKKRMEDIPESSVLTHLYSGKPPCLISHQTALASIDDATASPLSAALLMKNYPAEFCQI